MKRLTLTLMAQVSLGCAIFAVGGLGSSCAAQVVPHPMIERTGGPVTKQLGDFGESVVGAGLRARGFEVADGNIGLQGIDRIAVKRAPDGGLLDVRFIEVKSRQHLPDFQLSVTRDGAQLSDAWLKPRLGRIILDHPNADTRQLATQLLEILGSRPELIRRELHGIAVAPDKYVVIAVDDAGRVTGVAAEGRLTTLLEMLAKRGTSEETRAVAAQHLEQFARLQVAVAKTAPQAAQAKVGVAGLRTLFGQRRMPLAFAIPRRTSTVILEDVSAARTWAMRVARQPGVLAAGGTFVVDEGFSGWRYYTGQISKGDFQRATGQNAIKAGVVGIATQLVYILAPTPHGLVVVGVAIVAYVAAEQAIGWYNRTFNPEVPKAIELTGIIPARCLAVPMLEDVATGNGARRAWSPCREW